jgi:hypothetical protein
MIASASSRQLDIAHSQQHGDEKPTVQPLVAPRLRHLSARMCENELRWTKPSVLSAHLYYALPSVQGLRLRRETAIIRITFALDQRAPHAVMSTERNYNAKNERLSCS